LLAIKSLITSLRVCFFSLWTATFSCTKKKVIRVKATAKKEYIIATTVQFPVILTKGKVRTLTIRKPTMAKVLGTITILFLSTVSWVMAADMDQ